MDKYIGKRLDARYEVHELVGVGGMSLVYRAYDVIEARNVAIKILKDEYFGNKEFMRRFKNESQAISVLSHPNIVKILNVSFGTNFQYIVMEYIFGVTLKEYISKKDNFGWHEAVDIIKQVLLAISHAHSRGIIHRDIKPQNIMVLDDGTVKVTDFGIARFFSNETQTMTDKAIGSVHYISPEQAKGLKTDFKSDIYSVGVVLYEMLTRKLPFEADNAVSVAIMQMQVTPKAPRLINPSIPVALEEITLKAMQKNPESRYFTAKSMLDDISEFEKNNNKRFGYSCFIDDNPTRVLMSNDSDDDNLDEDPKKRKMLFIVGGIAATLVIFSLIFMFITMFTPYGSKSVDVPNFIGQHVSDVQNDKQYKFRFQIENVKDPSKPDGVIIDQDPPSGSKKVKSNSTIVLKVNSSGISLMVPKVVGMTYDEAKSKILNAGFNPEVVYITDSSVPADVVKAVDPPENSKVSSGSTVKIYVNKGNSQNVKIPNVVGKSLEDAKSEILSQNLSVSSDIKYENSDKEKDTVILTDPLPGISVSSGSSVKLVVSSGEKKEQRIPLTVDWSDDKQFTDDVSIKVYVDGELDRSKSTIVDSSVSRKTFYFSGRHGKKSVKVKINDDIVKLYEIDFDKSENNVELISN